MSIYSVSDFLTTTTYKGETVIDVFKKIDIPDDLYEIGYYEEYIIKEGDRWDRLSNTNYGTPYLWWLLASYNKFIDPFTALIVGEKIKIIRPELISNLLLNLKGYLK